ncbi:Trypsin-1 [Blattella germanica]|nr:Trypsin-1 [Blattella germanica]
MFRLILASALFAISFGAAVEPSRPHLNGRIVGGTPVSFEWYEQHWCGGSIISPNWVLIATHCQQGKSIDSIRIRAGSTFKEQGGSIHEISEVIMHSEYSNYDYDVAVLKVAQPFEYSDSVQPIALADVAPKTGTPVIVTGWGDLQSGGPAPSQLQQIQVNIVDQEECDRDYVRYGGVTERMICAGVPEGGKDSCQGDSGGPMVANGQVVGIVSWGVGCADKDFPGVYSNVAELKNWVLSKTGLH